jgi:hypothetical protein
MEHDTKSKKKLDKELTDEERRVIKILKENRSEILSGFRDVLRKFQLDLHVVGYSLDEKPAEPSEIDDDCCCANPPPHYANPCSKCP